MREEKKDEPMAAFITLGGMALIVIGTIAGLFNIGKAGALLGGLFAVYIIWLVLLFTLHSLNKEWSLTKVGWVSLYFAIGTVLALAGLI